MAASSFSIWYKFDEQTSDNTYMLFYNRDGQHIRLSGNGSTRTVTAGNKNVAITNAFSSDSDFTSWHHYSFVQEDGGEALFYVDGELAGSVSNPGTNSVNSSLPTDSYIGGSGAEGRFDDFRSFKRKLTFREVEYLYNGGTFGGRSELALGPAPIDVAKGSESAAEASSLQIEINLPVQSIEVRAENSRVAVPVPVVSDNAQSQAQCEQVDVSENKFRVDGDPIIVGDKNTTSLERAVLEFSIEGVSTVEPVLLSMDIESVQGSFLAKVKRWTSDYPTTKQELESGSFTNSNSVSFQPSTGQVELDVTQLVIDTKASGSTIMRLMLEEQPTGTNVYYQIDNSTNAPSLKFFPTIEIEVDSAQSSSQVLAFNIPYELEVDSAEASSQFEEPLVFTQRLDIESAQSQANANYVAGFGVNLSLSPDDVESNSQAEQFKVRTNYLIIGDIIDFSGQSQAKPVDESPFFSSEFTPYDSSQSSYSQPESGGGTAFVNIRPDDVASVKVDIAIQGSGQFAIRSGGVTYATSSTDGLVVAEIPIGASDYSLEFNGTGAIKSIAVELAPFTADNVESPSNVQGVDVEVNATARDIESQAEVSLVNPSFSDFYVSGSFESGLDGWNIDGTVNTWERGEFGVAHDGTHTLRIPADSGIGHTISYGINTNTQGISQFRGHIYLEGSFSTFAGVEILDSDNNVVKSITSSNSASNTWIDFAIEVPKSADATAASDLTYTIRALPHPSLSGQYIHFDDFGFRAINTRLLVDGSQSSSINENVVLGINNIGGTAQDAQSQAEASQVSITIPATTDSAQSQAQASTVAVGRAIDLELGSLDISSEAASVTLSGDAVLLVDSAQSQSEGRKYNLDISPPDIQSFSNVSAITIGFSFDVEMDSASSAAQAEGVSVSGRSGLLVDSVKAIVEAQNVGVGSSFNLDMDSAESAVEMSKVGVASTVLIDPSLVKLCTPGGDSEDVVTGLAGEDIQKGEVVRLTGEDLYLLASSQTEEDSIYDGIAVTNAVAGEPVVVAVAGTVIIGSVLDANSMYILSPRKGRLKKANEVNGGEYISLVGIATGSDRLRLGNDFQSLLMTNFSPEPASGIYIEPVDATLTIENVVPNASRTSATEEILIGDLLNRNGDLTDSSLLSKSSFSGMAVSPAEVDCSYAFVPAGANVDLGSELLVANTIYVVSRRRGKMMPAEELESGDYATVVGIAVSERNIVLGSISKGTLAV